MRVRIDDRLCQGHGRCYDIAPGLFGEDDEGYGKVLGDGEVTPELEQAARLAVANCPERAVEIVREV
ncbi:ferredoxin [Spongiactinospora sp. TRM90649]|uniref:ferredoxin n=1 Tax=Spongiactinospora sp. TRM90649 TaxID=3031114 RepID=UPI0023F6A7A0|nr:ferredoxin [Spongiactinospora sp. TRM90649]MDF5754269.1 ferredoxin [Spongiactinospora sp. TRM90649]